MNELKHLSYSSISTYLNCPAMWKFRYIDKLPTFGNPNLFFGSVWHKAIEHYIQQSERGTGSLLDLFHRYWDIQLEKEGERMNWKDPYTGKSVEESTHEMGENWISGNVKFEGDCPNMATFLDTLQPKKKKGDEEKPYHVEDFIKLHVPGVPMPIIGYTDMITKDDIPVDFKTSGKSWSEKRATEEVQPLFYLAALSQAGIRVPGRQFRHIVFVKTKTPKVQVFTTSHHLAELLWLYRIIEGVWQAIEAEAFPVNPTTWLCSKNYCDYWLSCRGKFEGV